MFRDKYQWHVLSLFITYAKAELCDKVGSSVGRSVSKISAKESNQAISLKLDVMIWPTNCKNWLTFGGDPVPDTDSGSLFQFSAAK